MLSSRQKSNQLPQKTYLLELTQKTYLLALTQKN